MSNAYAFLSRWRVEGTCGEVADILGDPLALPRWWPSVYLDVDELRPPDARGLGRRVRLHTKGWLPYTLRVGVRGRRVALPVRLRARRERRFRRPRRVDVPPGRPVRRHHLRLAAARGEAAAPAAVVPDEAAVRSEPPVGDGAGRGEPEAGAGAAPRLVGRRARPRSRRRPGRSPMPASRSSAARWRSAGRWPI